jgi:murein DD-endopeptidase MepM/ murein hydrolase activator NlpD
MRSQGKVRFIKITARMQMAAAAAATFLVFVWIVSMAAMAVTQYFSTRDRLAMLDREAKVVTAESRVSAYRKNVDSIADDLVRRQDAMEKMVQTTIGDLPSDTRAGETVSDSSAEAARTINKVSMAVPGAAGLARAEARQLAFVEKLTRLADRRSTDAMGKLRKLGLNPEAMLASLRNRSAQGGPLIALTASGELDPRFERLGLSLQRMGLLERGVAGLPQHLPANLEYISSGFGYRSDPFTGAGAFHGGLDFRGPYGAPIYAAAKGTVSFSGIRSGYGKCVEIEHGNGLMTRYAHMSALRAAIGQPITAGDVIGLIGSTGRSTGPHLHFEVRVNDRPVNPRPFLESAPHVLEKAQGNPGSAFSKTAG